MSRRHRSACGLAALAAGALSLPGCGGAERRDAGAPQGTYTVAIERASFPRNQHLGQRSPLVITVRNTGEEAIPNLVVTVKGFAESDSDPRLADPTRDVWIVDSEPAGAGTAVANAWSAGRLEPGRSATLRWQATPVTPGTHKLSYAVAPALSGAATARLRGGDPPRGTLTVAVSEKPARARVDPVTGAVRRE